MIKMQGLLFAYILFLRLLFSATSGHVLVKRHSHQPKRMANPRDLLNDFVAINGAGAQIHDGDSGTGTKSGSCDGAPPCNVKEIMTPGDPKAKSSAIAQQAAQDAKAANEAQSAAGHAAAQHIKTELAEKAFQSAKAAEAALMGKQMMVDQLEQETQEATAVVEGETTSLQSIEVNMNSAVEATKAATQQFEALSELLTNSRSNLANIQSVAIGLQREMEAKTQLLEAARTRLASFQKQLSSAHEDYEKTKQAAYKAACAAVEAKQKAASLTQSHHVGVKREQREVRGN